MSGLKLERLGKDHAADIRLELQMIGERNVVEWMHGNGKRKLGLSLFMVKLQITEGIIIGIDILSSTWKD